jgi:hypothetical protein
MPVGCAELLLTLTCRACKCDRLLAAIKGAAFLRHFYMLLRGWAAAILLDKG